MQTLADGAADRRLARRDRGLGVSREELIDALGTGHEVTKRSNCRALCPRVNVPNKPRLDVAAGRSRPGAVARAGARADPRRAGHGRRPGRVERPARRSHADARVELVAPDHPYVGRGGVKLAHALDAFAHRPAGPPGARHRRVDRRLHRRAAAARRRERHRARRRPRPARLAAAHRPARHRARRRQRARADAATMCRTRSTLVTIDVAFISLRHILPALPPFLEAGADIVALVKPQFEAGRDEVGQTRPRHRPGGARGGHRARHRRRPARARTSRRVGMTPSPITGATGNQEFSCHLRAAAEHDRRLRRRRHRQRLRREAGGAAIR